MALANDNETESILNQDALKLTHIWTSTLLNQKRRETIPGPPFAGALFSGHPSNLRQCRDRRDAFSLQPERSFFFFSHACFQQSCKFRKSKWPCPSWPAFGTVAKTSEKTASHPSPQHSFEELGVYEDRSPTVPRKTDRPKTTHSRNAAAVNRLLSSVRLWPSLRRSASPQMTAQGTADSGNKQRTTNYSMETETHVIYSTCIFG